MTLLSEPLREFTRFSWWMQTKRRLKAAFHDTDIDSDTDSPDTSTSLRPTRPIKH